MTTTTFTYRLTALFLLFTLCNGYDEVSAINTTLKRNRRATPDLKRFREENKVVPIKLASSAELIFPEYRLKYCGNPKCMSTTMKKILCDIFMLKRNIHSADLSKSSVVCSAKKFPEWMARFKDTQHPSTPSLLDITTRIGRTDFTFVRHPVERFVSAYAHLCIRNKLCGAAGRNIHEMARSTYFMLKNGRIPPGSKRFDHLKHHFAPQTSYCHLGDTNYHMLKLRHSNYNTKENMRQILQLFKRQGIPITYIEKALAHMKKAKTAEEESRNDEVEKLEWIAEIYSTPDTLNWIVRSYYYDFLRLGYEYPYDGDSYMRSLEEFYE